MNIESFYAPGLLVDVVVPWSVRFSILYAIYNWLIVDSLESVQYHYNI